MAKAKPVTAPKKPKATVKAKAKTTEASVVAAQKSFEDGELEKSLAQLIAVWRTTPDDALADVITQLSDKLAEDEEPIVAVGSKSAKTRWYEVVNENRVEMLPHLLESLPDGIDRLFRLDEIKKLDRDPRFTKYARRWLHRGPIKGSNRAPFFLRVISVIESTKDPRINKTLAELTTADERSSTVRRIGQRAWKPLVALRDALADLPSESLAASEKKALDAIAANLGSKTKPKPKASNADAQTFFAKVYAAPADDEPRAVLSDLLQQQNDPRGEFIALQLARHDTNAKPSPKERKLEDTWGRKWLGPLDAVLLKTGVVYERGFLSRAIFNGGSVGAGTAGKPEWSTVTHLDCKPATGFMGGSHAVVTHDVMRSLRHVINLGQEDAKKLFEAKKTFPQWDTIGFDVWDAPRFVASMTAHAPKVFPSAKAFILSNRSGPLAIDPAIIEALVKNWPSLKVLEVAENPANLGLYVPRAPLKKLERLTLNRTDQVSAEYTFATKSLLLTFEQTSATALKTAVEAVKSLHKNLSATTIRATGRVTKEGTKISRGRYAAMDVSELEKAIAAASATLTYDL